MTGRAHRVSVEVLAVDRARLDRAIRGEAAPLGQEIGRRGRRLAAAGRPAERVDPASSPADRVPGLRVALAWQAALVSVHRFDYATGREGFRALAVREELLYEEKLGLDRDLVPGLKEEAKALRAEIRGLEAELRARGVDPGAITPPIEWDRTLAVDDYQGPSYESVAERRAKAVEFFRRIG